MKCDTWHQTCGCVKMLGGLLWFLGFVSLILAWVAARNGEVFGYDAIFWMMNTLALGILATPLKLKKRKCCMNMMGCGDGGMKQCCDKKGEQIMD